MTEHKTIAAALAAFQAEAPTVSKGKTAKVPTKSGGSYSYSYADLATVAEAAYPLLSKHGLSFSCAPRRTDAGSYELVGRLLHASGEEISGALPIHGVAAQDIGSSLTYGRRYLLGCITGIVTDEDDDAQSAPREPLRQSVDPLAEAKARAWAASRDRAESDNDDSSDAARKAHIAEWLAVRGLTLDTATVQDYDDYTNGVVA